MTKLKSLKNKDVNYLTKMRRIYVDHAATTKLSAKAFEAMKRYYIDDYFNPSTLYSDANICRRALADARECIAKCIGAQPNEIIFTSGGTEADNCVIKNIAFNESNNRRTIITSQIEHHAILNSCKIMENLGYPVIYLPVSKDGTILLDALEAEINADTALVSVMYVNNEIGTIQNIKDIAEISHKAGAIFHTDAVQAIGHIEVNVKKMDIDMLSASAHKFNGPKGVGFLYKKDAIKMNSYISGGNQEFNLRAGTENVAGIVGMAVALKENVNNIKANTQYLLELEEIFIRQLKEYEIDFIRNGSINKCPGNISISFPGISGEMILHRLDLKGVQIATGSACDSKNLQLSHVIKAIGVPELYAKGTIRISLGTENTIDDMIYIAKELANIIHK